MAFSAVLSNHNSGLEKLDLDLSYISILIIDDVIVPFSNALAINSRLQDLALSCYRLSATGWMAILAVLRSPKSVLERLNLDRNNPMNDQAIISHADALASNSSLKELELDLCNYSSGVTSEGYAALTRMLCNSSSIVSTYHSNHTTEKLCSLSDECKLPEEVKTFLRLNKENSKSQAARIKIIKTHLSGCEINMQPFVNMELSIHPHANAWMARDYHLRIFVRAVPSLLEKVSTRGQVGWLNHENILCS